jgi:hypothetical protein
MSKTNFATQVVSLSQDKNILFQYSSSLQVIKRTFEYNKILLLN